MKNKLIKSTALLLLISLMSSCSITTNPFVSDNTSITNSDIISSDDEPTSSNITSSDEPISSDTSSNNSSSSTSSSSSTFSSSSSSSSIGEEPSDNYYRLNDKTFTIHDVSVATGISSTPTRGDVNIIVVPVEFKDLTKFTSNDLNTMNVAFNGDKEDNSNSYWESVKSFYYKSSFGKLNLNFVFTDIFTPSLTSTLFKKYEDTNSYSDGTGTFKLITSIYKTATINNKAINWDNYDVDNDGSVDGIWLIYNEKDSQEGQDYWPYVYWYNYSDDYYDFDENLTLISNYGNCAMSFMYEDSDDGYDAHTLIHETGHLLGFDDYYTYDTDNQGYNLNDPQGGYDMQNLNIGDQGSYTKTIADWISPIVVTGDTTITINSYSTTGDAIIIPANQSNFNQSGFNEYILLELYTPEGLYERDAKNIYPGRPTYYQNTGVRMFYIDSRIANVKTNSRGNVTGLTYINKNTSSLTYPSVVAHSNSYATSYAYEVEKKTNEFLYSMIAKGVNHNLYNYKAAYDEDTDEAIESYMFYKGDSFRLNNYSKLFRSNKYFHDGSSVNFSITIDDISSKQATISVKYN